MMIKGSERRSLKPLKGVHRETLVWGTRAMLVKFKIEKGALIPEHSHFHEQIGVVFKGKLKLRIEGKEFMLGEGDSYLVPSNAPHSAEAVEEVVVVDCFSPPREDYKE